MIRARDTKGYVRLTAEEGKSIVDLRNGAEYSEVVCKEKDAKFFIEEQALASNIQPAKEQSKAGFSFHLGVTAQPSGYPFRHIRLAKRGIVSYSLLSLTRSEMDDIALAPNVVSP